MSSSNDVTGEAIVVDGFSAYDAYCQHPDADSLRSAISALRRALHVSTPASLSYGDVLAALENLLRSCVERSADQLNLNALIDLQVRATSELAKSHPRYTIFVQNLAVSLVARYRLLGDLADLDAAIENFADALSGLTVHDPKRPGLLANLGRALTIRFQESGSADDLRAAIDAQRFAVVLTPDGDAAIEERLSDLARSVQEALQISDADTNSERLIAATRQILDETPQPMELQKVADEATRVAKEYQRSGDRQLLDNAIVLYVDLLSALDESEPSFSMHLANLGSSLLERTKADGDNAALNEGIRCLADAVRMADPADKLLGSMMTNLAIGLHMRYTVSNLRDDLNEAVNLTRKASILPASDGASRSNSLGQLAMFLLDEFSLTGNTSALQEALGANMRALQTAQVPDISLLVNRAKILARGYEQTGRQTDLEDADRACKLAMEIGTDFPAHRETLLSTRAAVLFMLYERSAHIAELNLAIDFALEAAEMPGIRTAARAGSLSNLASHLHARFEEAGDNADLIRAVRAAREAVAASNRESSELLGSLATYGNVLLAQFKKTSELPTVNLAIEVLRQAVEETPIGHLARPRRLLGLGNALLARFRHVRHQSDLDDVLELFHEAEAAGIASHLVAVSLTNLGNALVECYKQSGSVEDLEAAIGHMRAAIDALPKDHPRRTISLMNLATGLNLSYRHSRDAADLDAAISIWREAFSLKTGRPSARLMAARAWGWEAGRAGRTGDAAEGYAAAVSILPIVAWHGLDGRSRTDQLEEYAGLTADAAAWAIKDGRPDEAVRLLEKGRSILWTQALNIRTSLAEVAAMSPDLAMRLEKARGVLDRPLLSYEEMIGEMGFGHSQRVIEPAAEERKRAAREWDSAVAEVRRIGDGFEYFLDVPPFKDLTKSAVDGPVVVLNVSEVGCHALIVSADEDKPQVLELPMTLSDAVDRANQMRSVVAGDSGVTTSSADHVMEEVLSWLWKALCMPVFKALRYTSRPTTENDLPRIWWCPTGAMTVLPIHAAGTYGHATLMPEKTEASAFNYVISSYTTTLVALIRSRDYSPGVPISHLTVSLSDTPGLAKLPAVHLEEEVIQKYFKASEVNTKLAGPEATRENVLSSLSKYTWVHFACHAGQFSTDLLESGLALWDGNIIVSDLSSLSSRGHDMAFLSACQTAEGNLRHLDEAIHLAAAMQFIGFRHVVATQWAIADAPAPWLADAFYAALSEGGVPDATRAAGALHHATRAVRSVIDKPLVWAPYIHFGP